ncbi:MAG: hypothetical protein KME27_02975 [Lyngbya sp. HA4199-MV5]|nr:hypothetical protein [Lyngbya sp. HA4199-MV5]
MKCWMLPVSLMLLCLIPFTLYTPPTKGGPGSSRGSGTRILRPDVRAVAVMAQPDVVTSRCLIAAMSVIKSTASK